MTIACLLGYLLALFLCGLACGFWLGERRVRKAIQILSKKTGSAT